MRWPTPCSWTPCSCHLGSKESANRRTERRESKVSEQTKNDTSYPFQESQGSKDSLLSAACLCLCFWFSFCSPWQQKAKFLSWVLRNPNLFVAWRSSGIPIFLWREQWIIRKRKSEKESLKEKKREEISIYIYKILLKPPTRSPCPDTLKTLVTYWF